MHIKTFSHQGIRNLEQGKFLLNQGLNVFFGDNGAGKSSILEAICFLTSGRSFRTSKLDLVVSDNNDQFIVFGLTTDETRIGVGYQRATKQRSIKINGEKHTNLSSLNSIYPTQILSPESYHLIDSGPSERRKYLDWCLFHVKHNYHSKWKNYNNILKQRNALLRQSKRININEQLSIWDEQFLEAAELVNIERVSILEKLTEILNKTISMLDVDFCNNLKLSYYPGFTGDLTEKLSQSLRSDIESGFTKFGPHKADLRIKVDGHLAKDFLSRGQKKVLINALYLSQTILLKSHTDKSSLFIIDDFTSELDDSNQKALLNLLLSQENVQIILSCLQQDSLNWLKKGYNSAHMFHVERGCITSTEQLENNRNN